jgi:glycosyltransferase involved in cell wall biosynthesis
LERDRNFKEHYYTVVFYPLKMQRRVINRLDRVITSSQETAKEIQQAFKVPTEKIRMVYNGLDTDFFRPERGGSREKNRLLFVGNTDDTKKGIIYLLRGLALLPAEITLTIVDSGAPMKTYAPGIVTELNLASRVTFTGKVSQEELRELYSTSEAVVLPSLYEGFGLPAAEAMACGTPVVATMAGALPEVVGREGAGILVAPRSGKALATAIQELLRDESRKWRMGQLGRKRAEDNFTWRKVAERTVGVYKELL